MRRCCGCHGGAVDEPEEAILDLVLLEAAERSLKFSFCSPRASTRFQSSSASSSSCGSSLRIGRGPLEFVISILGGPYSDLRGAREERLYGISCGKRVVHEVSNLQPETEYTINVVLIAADDGRRVWQESLEARTANATTCLFAEEDWGRKGGKDGLKDKDGKSPEKEGKETKESGGATSSWMSTPGASSSSASAAAADVGPQAGRQDSQDDVSTIAPSEALPGEDADAAMRASDDHGSDCSSESGVAAESTLRSTSSLRPAAATAGSSALAAEAAGTEEALTATVGDVEAVQEIKIIEEVEVTASARRSVECKFCSILDCLRSGKKKEAPLVEDDIIIDHQTAAPAPKPKPKAKRGFRPYRMPFPGTPVDPRTVGLTPGPGDLV